MKIHCNDCPIFKLFEVWSPQKPRAKRTDFYCIVFHIAIKNKPLGTFLIFKLLKSLASLKKA